jgi:hypothetical protein
MLLITLSTAWLIGIAAAHYLSPPLAPSAALRAGSIGLLAVLPLAGLILSRDDAKVRRIAARGLFLLLGSLRYTLFLPDLSDFRHVAAYRDQAQVTLWGRVIGEPDVRDTYANLRLVVDRVRIEDEEHLVKGKLLLRARQLHLLQYSSLDKRQDTRDLPR